MKFLRIPFICGLLIASSISISHATGPLALQETITPYPDPSRFEKDIQAFEAVQYSDGYRQVEKRDARLDVKKLANQIADEITNHRETPNLNWITENRVRVNIGVFIKANNKQTLAGRRKRFS
jgi:hypothetical protein